MESVHEPADDLVAGNRWELPSYYTRIMTYTYVDIFMHNIFIYMHIYAYVFVYIYSKTSLIDHLYKVDNSLVSITLFGSQTIMHDDILTP